MLYSLIIIFVTYYTSSVAGFYYKALPLVVIQQQDGQYRAFCPWNDTYDPDLSCRATPNAMGYHHKTRPLSDKGFFNPTVQKLFDQDHCKHLKDTYETAKTNVDYCKNYSQCYNLSNEHSLCSCQAGFFGDPYVRCKKHCVADSECLSPLAYCKDPGNNMLPYCECKAGYQGDGLICTRNPCGDDRFEKCGTDRNKVCVPTGPGENDYRCMCPDGTFLDYNNKCVPEVTLVKDTVFTLTGKNVENGSRVEAGDCLSFTLNDGHKSIFFHKNSGDSIYVKRNIMNEGSFTLFFVLTDEVTAFSQLEGTNFGLSKLYSISNTFKDCKFGQVKVVRPNGQEVVVSEHSTEKVEVKVRSLSVDELMGGLESSVKLPQAVLPGEDTHAEVRPLTVVQHEASRPLEL